MAVPFNRPDRKARRKLAIVSTYDDLCGIAGYTRSLAKQLSADWDVRVFDLDQFFMRSSNRHVRKLADEMIADMCRQFGSFDCVNVQLEYGTLGSQHLDIRRRFRMLAEAAPRLSVTFHTVLLREDVSRLHNVFWLAVTGRWRRALDALHARRLEAGVAQPILQAMRRLQRRKWVSAVVHTRRDARTMRHVNRLQHVFDHPLAFLSAEQAERIRKRSSRSDFPALASLPREAKIVGVFGFLSDYKGIETAIRALRHVPDDYHLAIFGGVHPAEIRRGPGNPYVLKLLEEVRSDSSIFDDVGEGRQLNVSISAAELPELYRHPKNVARRVHFMGAQDDDQFAGAIAVCDIVVLSYHEVGQSSSGPMSIAVEMGSRVIAARNHAFLQFARYNPDRLEFFDIGNHLELAERLRAPAPRKTYPAPSLDIETNAAIYFSACGLTRTDAELQPTQGAGPERQVADEPRRV